MARGARDEALYVADEDHAALRVVPLPFGSAAVETVELPGRPAEVLVLDDRVLVTVRDPGLLLSLVRRDGALVIAQRVPLAGDAWGIAVDPDERGAIVTSAWSHRVSAVDLASGAVRWTLDVAREPRGVVIAGGRAYVTHLVGTAVTRIDGIDGEPVARRIELPAGRFTAPIGGALDASLAYAPVLSPDGARLFVPRHALGGVGWEPWFGRPVVDVLLTADDSPLAPARGAGAAFSFDGPDWQMSEDGGKAPALPLLWTVQPRAAAFRASTGTLLVASEGNGTLVELDARALDPSLHPVYRYELVHAGKDAERCGAPSGVATSRDETTAFVWCRTTGEIARVSLKAASFTAGPDGSPDAIELVRVAEDGPAAIGRRLFYDARADRAENRGVSGGLGCAGCHPDGRDDGHVWRERADGGMAGAPLAVDVFGAHQTRAGAPRQTPMLAGRVDHAGPYGWHGEDGTLEQRILTGFGLHRWFGSKDEGKYPTFRLLHLRQATALAAFLREGLVPPPLERRAFGAEELRGKALFESSETECASCHAGDGTRQVVALALPPSPLRSDVRDGAAFRVPSLRFVGGTAPYYHDGRAVTLAELVESIGDGMGRTSGLAPADRAALAAYLATIGMVSGEAAPPSEAPQALPFAPRIAEEAGRPARASYLADPPGDAPTPAPSRAEWDAAPETRLDRTSDGCRVWRVREWLRVQCAPGTLESWRLFSAEINLEPVFRVALVAGSDDGVGMMIEHRTGWKSEGALVFPLRRGDRRLFTIDRRVTTGLCLRWSQWFEETTFVISESWLPGDAAPQIAVTRTGRHPSTGVQLIRDTCSS